MLNSDLFSNGTKLGKKSGPRTNAKQRKRSGESANELFVPQRFVEVGQQATGQ